MRRRHVRLLGMAIGAALACAPLPVAGASVRDLDPSPSRVVVRDGVWDVWREGTGQRNQREFRSVNLTRLSVTYRPQALLLQSSYVDLRERAVVRRGQYMDYRIGTPRHPFIPGWEIFSGFSHGEGWVEIGADQPATCSTAWARWVYREDVVIIRVPWSCLPDIGGTVDRPRRVIVRGESSLDHRSDYVPGRADGPDEFTPPVVRPRA